MKMSHSNVTQVQLVRILYKSLLRLHRGLPQEMRLIGDQYVKDEFRRHKTAKPEQAQVFLSEWINYASDLSNQLGLRGLQSASKLGRPLTDVQLDHFQETQLGQLLELYKETNKIYQPDNK